MAFFFWEMCVCLFLLDLMDGTPILSLLFFGFWVFLLLDLVDGTPILSFLFLLFLVLPLSGFWVFSLLDLVGWRKLEQNEICGRQPDLQCGLDLVVLMVLIEANIYFSFSGGFLYFRGGRWWTVLVEDRIEPNRTEINRFESVFNLVWFKHF